MHAEDGSIAIGGTSVSEGTSLYDTENDRVLWVVLIGGTTIALEPAASYEDEILLEFREFRARVTDGRFEVGPQPVVAEG